MQQITYFIRKFKYFLLFIILEILAIYFTIQHHSYHKSKFVNSANFVTGGIYNKVNSINEFFYLKTDNQLLIEENTRLKNLLEKKHISQNDSLYKVEDSTQYFQKYQYIVGKVINNNFTKRDNYLTLNKGSNYGLTPDLGIINGNGVIGVIKNVSSNFATVLSILNSNSKINVRLKRSPHFGTLVWNGKDYNTCQVTDIPRQAIVKVGDTIITGGKSTIFPEGIVIGTIKDFTFENNQYQQINVSLFNDMSSIGYVQIVKNLIKEEQIKLEESAINE